MTCDDARDLLEAYLDGELPAEDRTRLEAHLPGCPACTAELGCLRALSDRIRTVGPHPVPDGLAARVAAVLAEDAPAGSGRREFARMVASHAAAALFGAGAVALLVSTMTPQPPPLRDLVSAHVRGLALEEFGAVRSGDPHAVRPWFAGKIGFSPRVVDLAGEGYPLLGGRVDHVAGRPAAALVYGRRNHRITLFVAPLEPGGATASERLHGYNVESWQADGFRYDAVSDLNREELAAFAAALRAR
jgi:anti-sigma factor (TIGR02949 family)